MATKPTGESDQSNHTQPEYYCTDQQISGSIQIHTSARGHWCGGRRSGRITRVDRFSPTPQHIHHTTMTKNTKHKQRTSTTRQSTTVPDESNSHGVLYSAGGAEVYTRYMGVDININAPVAYRRCVNPRSILLGSRIGRMRKGRYQSINLLHTRVVSPTMKT